MRSSADWQLDEALDEARSRYEELFDLSPLAQLVTDDAGLILEANTAFSELVVSHFSHLIGKPLAVFFPLDARKQFRERLASVGHGGGRQRWRTEVHGRDDARIAVDVLVVGRPEGDLLRLRWVIQDVSERHFHEEQLRRLASESEERVLERTAELEQQRALLEAVIENIPAGVIVVDANLKPIVVNDEGLRVLGLSSEESDDAFATWRRARLLTLDGHVVQDEERPFFRTLDRGEVVTAETYEIVLDGRHAVFETSTAPVASVSGEPIGALVVLRDVTTRERTEQAERDFVTNAAHELQSPLAAIVSAVEVLQAGAKEGPERDLFLGHIEREADRLARLARALLILARTQIGIEAPRDELVGIHALLTDVAGLLKVGKGVEVEVACPEDLAMLTNRELVEQAMVNLAENAAKHTTSGLIVLSARAQADRLIELAVSDTGPGIAASERPKVFDRFYRAEADGTSGFGLGLSIVRAVVAALDGELELDSAVEVGTTFTLRIPGAATLVEG